MTFLHESIPVFVVEDNETHSSQIKSALEEEGFVVRISNTGSRVELYSYKARHSAMQIVIVDLDLGLAEEVDPEQGYELVREQIWPYDRTTIFIVFSEHIELSRSVAFGKLDPHWCFVSKGLEPLSGSAIDDPERRLTKDCLDELLRMVRICSEMICPTLTSPHLESYAYLREVNDYGVATGVGPNRYRRSVESAVVKSVSILNDLSRASVSFGRAGAATKEIAIGVYGSCGRLEMRDDSDIEFSVFYSAKDKEITVDRRLIASLWTRIAYHLTGLGLAFEGSAILAEQPHVLVENQVGEQLLNKYHAVLCSDYIIDSDLRRDPHMRNRHLQVLTELRPIFNPEFIREMKKAMLTHQIGKIEYLEALVESHYFADITNQYLMDSASDNLLSWTDMKRFCYRTMNVMALRAGLVCRLQFDEASSLKGNKEWDDLFDWLTWPGLLKLTRFANVVKEKHPSSGKAKVVSLLDGLIGSYYEVFARFAEYVGNPSGLRPACRQAVLDFSLLMNHLVAAKAFKGVARKKWLFSNESILERVQQWQS